MAGESPAARVRRAATALAVGGLVVVVDGADRENEADLLGAAELMTREQMTFLVRHTSGIVCAPMSAERCAELRLPQMVERNTDAHNTAFTVSVDHVDSGTGVSAAARTRTVHALADCGTAPEQLNRPGHVFPLRARDGGVLVRPGHTEAAVDLLAVAGVNQVGVISELVAADGEMLRGHQATEFADEHKLPLVTVADLVHYRLHTEKLVERAASATLPTTFGEFRAIAYRNTVDGTEHLALTMGDITAASHTGHGVLTRVHSECLTGDILGSTRCDCGAQLRYSAQLIADEGTGVIVYLRGHEGRGIGLANKIHAYAFQDQGLDTVDANIALGLPVDARHYDIGAQILVDIGASRLRMITNNPAKTAGLEGYDLDIAGRIPLPTTPTQHNLRYLRTKRDRMGHDLAIGRDQPAISTVVGNSRPKHQ
ncbi:bifunctional 3,4-dihydroxy-2-butanone-4-phosphate synthase/GTP cyclohydrolase II [Nocardia sp. NBC_01499]|uniref:bifunctional 3,4-dihydroxy-2-butanone-4-phosphate synthase/GTP cyclohydrolase II n=1 Tax=Nocardia sp. NBC_01499 TaxID=2903597 RepID=UPI0038650D68